MRDIDRINLQGGFLEFIPLAINAIMSTNNLIKSIEGPPSIKPVTIPGILGLKEIDQSIVEQINKSRQELETVYQTELELAKKQQQLEQQIIKRQKLIETITKLAPFIVIGGVILAIILLKRGRK